jgi:hypothetical protein
MMFKDRSELTQKCPKCDSDRVGRAHRIGLLDRVLSLVNVYPYRCRKYSCKNRFHSFGRYS